MKQKDIKHIDSKPVRTKSSDMGFYISMGFCWLLCFGFGGAMIYGIVRLNQFVQGIFDVSFILADWIINLFILAPFILLACICAVSYIIKKITKKEEYLQTEQPKE